MMSGSFFPYDPSYHPGIPLDTTDLAAEVRSLAREVHRLVKNPSWDSADPCDVAQRLSRLEVRARNLTTDNLSRLLVNLRGLLEPAL